MTRGQQDLMCSYSIKYLETFTNLWVGERNINVRFNKDNAD